MASFSEWSNNKKKNEGTQAIAQKAETFSAWSNQKLGVEDTQQNNYTSKNTGFDRSGKSRDEYDSGVRQSYAARVSGKLTEGEYNRSADTQQKYGSYQNYLAGATADGKYYSQPELGRDTERLRNTYTTYETATQKAQSAYETAVNRLSEIEEQLEQMSPLLSQLQQYYETGPSETTKYLYTAKVNEYNSLADEYRELDGDLPGLYSDYERSYGKYSGALDAYNTYQTGEQEKYQSWKGTIRTDEDAINADLTAAQANVEQLQAQQQELYNQAQQLMSKVSSRQGGTNELMQWSRQAQALREQAKAMDSRIAEAQSAADLLQEELTWSDYYRYADLKNAPDWADKSRYKSTKTGEAEWSSWAGTYTDTGYGDILYDYINGDENAQSMQALKDLGGPGTLYATTHDGWKDLPEDVVKIFNYLYAQDTANGDTEHKAAYEYLDKAASRGYTGIEATTYGLLQGTGLASASAALGSTLGDEESKARSDEWYGQFLRDAERAKEEHSAMYTAGSIGGNLLLMYAVGGAAGAAARTLGLGAGALSTQMAMGALSFAGANALQNAGAAATGRMDTDDYLKGIAVSGLQGMAGNLAGGLMSSGMAGLLWYKGLMTPFMEFVRQTASGMTNAAVNQAVGYVAADEKPSSEEIASGLVTAFAFSVLTGAIGAYQTTQTQKANMKAACKVIEQSYRAMLSGTETMTAEAKAQRAQFILKQTQSLRKSMNSYYIAGQQKAVNSLNVALDIIEQSMKNYIAGYNAAPASVLLPGYLLPETAGIGMLPETAGIGMLPETAGIGMLPTPADTQALKMTAPALTQQVEQGLQTAIRQGLTQQPTRQPTQAQTGTLAAAAAQSMAAQPEAQSPQRETSTQPIARQLMELGEQPQTARKTAQNIEAFLRGELTDGQAVTELVSNPAATQVLQRMMTRQAEQTTPAAQNTPKAAQSAVLPAQRETTPERPGMLPTAAEAESRTLNNGTIEGGASYGTEQQGYDAADGRTIQLPDGNGGRISGESAGGQSGILAEGRPQRAAEQSRAAVERQNTGRALRLQKVSSRELGLENGTDARTLTVLPEIEWDEGLRRTARRVTRETGKAVTMVLGGIQIRTGGGIAGARGVYSDTGIILQADNFKLSTDQIADHEIFHDYADSTPGLIQSVEQAIVERYGREEFDKILTTYIQKLRGVIDLPKNAAEAEIEDALLDVKNEVFADAYAGINAFGAHAEKYRDTTRQTLAERGVIASRENAAATDRRTGPPERFSVEETDDGRAVAVVDNDILSHIDTSAWDDTKKAQAKAAAKTALLAFKDGIQVNGITYKVNKTARDEFTRSNDTERLYRRQPETFADKMRAADVVDDVITATTSWANDGMLKHPRTDNFVDFVHGDVLIQAGGNQYDAKTVVGITANGEYVFYDVVDMTPTAFQMKEEPSTAAAGKNAASAIQESSSKDRVAQTGADVKREDEEEMPGQPDPAAGVWDAAWNESANKDTAQSGTLAEAIASAQNDGAQAYTERTDAAAADAPAAPALKMTAPALTQQVEQGLQTAIRQGLTQQAATDRRTGPPERFSIGEITGDDQTSYGIGVHLDSTLLENLTPKEKTEMVKERVKELGGEVFTAYDSTGKAVDISIAKPEERFKNRNGKTKPVNKDLTTKYSGSETKQESVVLLDELIETANFDASKVPAYSHDWLDNNGKNEWEYWTTYVQDKNGTIWEATLNVANAADGRKILYDIGPIKKAGQSVKSDTSLLPTGPSGNSDISTVKPIVADEDEPVKTRLSIDEPAGQIKDYTAGGNEMQNTAASFRKTAVNDDPGQHTAAEQRLIEEYKAGADRNLAAFIQQVRGLQNRNYKNGIRQTIATQTDNAVRKALELTGVNTSGYKNIINGSSVQHIDKRHGADGTADHSMANIEDFARIGFVLDNFTDARVLRASETDQETARLARGWRNSDNTYAPLVQFSMPVNGTYYVVEAVPSSKAHVMAVISAYMSSDAKKQQHPQSSAETAGVPTASVTSETPHELLDAVDNTVPQRGNAVKRMPLTQPDPAAGVWDAAWNESINKDTARRGIAEGEPNAASPDGAALSDAQMPAQQELEITAQPAAADTGETQIRTAETVADEIAAQLDPAAGEIAAQPGTLAEAIASAQLELETSAEISSDTYLDQDKQFVEDPFDENGDLKKNVRYRSGDFKNYAYETDELGRIIKAVADDLRLKLSKGRYRHDPNSPGKELGDEAGHLFADMFGGSPLKDNIVSQLKKVNRSDWAALEQAWKKALLNGQEVRVAIDVLYSGNSLRPDGFMVQYTVDGVQHSAVKLTISNI